MDIITEVVSKLVPNCNLCFEASNEQIEYLFTALTDNGVLFEVLEQYIYKYIYVISLFDFLLDVYWCDGKIIELFSCSFVGKS